MKLEMPKIKSNIPKTNFPANAARIFKNNHESKGGVSSATVACDFGKSKIILLQMERTGNSIRLKKFHKVSRPADPAKDSEVLRQAIEAGGFAANRVRISVKGQGVILRFIQFPQMKESELRSALTYELDQYIPFKAPDVIWDFHILEENIAVSKGSAMSLLLVAVKRDELLATMQMFERAGLQIDLIDVDALAVMNALEFFQPESFKTAVGILDIGTEISTLSFILNGKPRFIRDISHGGQDIIKRMKRKLGLTAEQAVQQIEVDHAPTPEAAAVLKEGLGDLVSDIKVSLNYYLDQVQSAEPVKTLFVSGGGGYQPIMVETLKTDLGFDVAVMDILSKIEIDESIDKEFVARNQGLLPVALGLCLRPL